MKRRLVLLMTCLFCSIGLALAQNKRISGTVVDSNGDPVTGATVVVKGTTVGVSTDVDGKYSISVPQNGKTLVISLIGSKNKEVTVGDNLKIVLESDNKSLDEVVVTALGMKRSQKSIGYAVTTIKSDDITATGNRSALNALQGKIAGVEFSSASGAPGASTRVILRGYTSLSGSNQPLYIIDGVPMDNSVVNSTSLNGSFDFGNRANDINPNDIESISVLKGGQAAALYGSRANAGAIIITTKNGSKAGNKAKIEFVSTTTFDRVLKLPKFQNEFGQGWYNRTTATTGDLQENGSWGPKFDGEIRKWGFEVDNQQQIKPYSALKDNVKDFFDTGVSLNNNLTISSGNDNQSFYLSLGNISQNGIMPTDADKITRNNVALKGSTKFLKIFTVDASISYVNKNSKFVLAGQQNAALDAVWQTPRDISLVDLKDYNNKFNNIENYYNAYSTNPYYFLNNVGTEFKEDRAFGNVNLDMKITNWLSASFRVGGDASNSTAKQWTPIIDRKRYNYENTPGFVGEYAYKASQFNTDVVLKANTKFGEDFSFDALIGHNFNERRNRSLGAEVTGLDIPNFYSLSNSFSTPNVFASNTHRRLVGVYSQVDLGYKDFLFINLTARNDWSSTLPINNNSFFYPGVGVGFVFSDLLKKSDAITYGKLRASVAQTGKDADPYLVYEKLIHTTYTDGYRDLNFPRGGVNGFTVSNTYGNEKLKPEIGTNSELGLEMKFFQNRLGFDLTGYKNVTKDLIWTAARPATSGFTTQTMNLGQITNKGIEISLYGTPVKTKDIEWEIFGNFSKNKNTLDELNPDISAVDNVVSIGGTSSIPFVIKPGEDIGLYQGVVPKTDGLGRVVVDNQGLPVFKDTKEILGSSQHKFRMGGGTALTYRNFKLRGNFEYRYGGLYYSRTAEILYFTGNAIQTTYNDRQPFVIPNSVQEVNGQYVENTTPIAGYLNTLSKYYNQSYMAGKGAKTYLIDRTFFKLREVSLSYTIPTSLLNRTKVIKNASVSLVGTNLFIWTPSSNTFSDPEQTTFGNDLASSYGDYGATPTTRSIGFNIKLGF